MTLYMLFGITGFYVKQQIIPLINNDLLHNPFSMYPDTFSKVLLVTHCF